jgi:hypothetical protein
MIANTWARSSNISRKIDRDKEMTEGAAPRLADYRVDLAGCVSAARQAKQVRNIDLYTY